MKSFGFAKYCFEEFGFMNRDKLICNGFHQCLVRDKGCCKRPRKSYSAKYYLLIETEDGQFSGKIFVDVDEYRKYKKSTAYKRLSVITNSKGHVRFSEDPEPEKAIEQVRKTAKTIAVQSVVVLIGAAVSLLISIAIMAMPLLR